MTALLTQHLATWIAADTAEKSGRGRSAEASLYGVKKLRELILELAVRGLLVPQNADDEPASQLLKKIAAEKAQLVKEGKIKAQKPLPPIADDEKPFVLPKGWEWVRFGQICTYIQRGKSPIYVEKSDFPIISQKCVRWYGLDLSQAKFIAPESLSKYEDIRFLRKGDILWNSTGTGTIGRAVCVPNTDYPKLVADSHVTVVRSLMISAIYMCRWIESPSVQSNIEGTASGSTNQIELNTSTVVSHLIPLPPLAEQQRIVAKVDELMALCDQLEQQQNNSQAAHQQLVSQLLNALTQAANTNDFQQAWQRIATHFDVLFTTEDSINQLKQSILQLAVMGKLVAQNADDEPASQLLKKIAAEKAQLVKDGKIKAQKPLPPIADDEKPFDLPKGWEWVRLGGLTQDILTGPFGSMIHKSDYIDNGVPLINPSHMINGKIVPDFSITISPSKVKELQSYELIENDIVMARRGEMGRCAIVDDISHGWLCGTGSFVLRFHSEINRRYIFLFFKTEIARAYLGGNSVGTTMTNLNHGILNAMPLMIPTAQEQQRIVAKVDELMALCDQLKNQLNQAKHLQGKIADVLVEQALV